MLAHGVARGTCFAWGAQLVSFVPALMSSRSLLWHVAYAGSEAIVAVLSDGCANMTALPRVPYCVAHNDCMILIGSATPNVVTWDDVCDVAAMNQVPGLVGHGWPGRAYRRRWSVCRRQNVGARAGYRT